MEGLALLLILVLAGIIYLLLKSPSVPAPAPAPQPTSEKEFVVKLIAALKQILEDSRVAYPSEDVALELIRIAEQVYARELPLPFDKKRELLRPQTPEETKALQQIVDNEIQTFCDVAEPQLAETLLKSFYTFLQRLPVYEHPQFTLPIAELVDLPSTMYDLITPFRDERLYSAERCRYIWDTFQQNSVTAGAGKAPVMPQHFKTDLPKNEIANLYLKGTPFNQLLQTHIPFGFDDEIRCTHHWCLGHNGTGKTTYLRYFIKADLERVERGECSLIVIDSKKLIREMRTLKQFVTTLEDRVIIVDPEHPIALNPFYLPQKQSRDVMRYMLANLSEASDLQTGALSFLVDAAATYDKPSLYTIRDFFTLKKGELPGNFDRFDNDTQIWFRSTFNELPHLTRSGINQRLANFIKDNATLCKMLNADRCALDLFDWLNEGGNVLLVDTDRGDDTPEATNILGRLFIALIDQVSTRRTKLDEHTLKPIFCYVDEAMDYIENDKRFADILFKARAQKIAMTVAHHTESQIDVKIQQALDQAGLRSHCPDREIVHVKTRQRNYTIPIQRLDFDRHLLHMSRDQYRAMRERMDDKYGVKAREPAAPDFKPSHDRP